MLCNSSQEGFVKGVVMSAMVSGPRAGYERQDPDRLNKILFKSSEF